MLSSIFGHVHLYLRDAEDQKNQVSAGLKAENIHNVTTHLVPEMMLRNLIRTKEQHIKFLTLYYFAWLLKVVGILIARRAWRETSHLFHVTWVSDWIWSPFYLLPFRRRIIGPIGSQPANFYERSVDWQASHKREKIKKILRLQPLNWLNASRSHGVMAIAEKFTTNDPWAIVKDKVVLSPVHTELAHGGAAQLSNLGPCLMFVGKNLSFKNFDLFLLIARRVRKLLPDMPVLVLGDGFSLNIDAGLAIESADVLRDMASREEILYLGLQKQSLLKKIYMSFDTVLLQTSSEAGGTAPIEALGFGAPVVCARDYGIDTFFPRGDYPFAVPYTSEEQFLTDVTNIILAILKSYDRKVAQKYFERLKFEQTQKKLTAFLEKIE